jgi:hypothetical protein
LNEMRTRRPALTRYATESASGQQLTKCRSTNARNDGEESLKVWVLDFGGIYQLLTQSNKTPP